MHTADLGAQKAAGSIPFQWDGTTDSGAVAPDGSYTFEVTAVQGGKKVDATRWRWVRLPACRWARRARH